MKFGAALMALALAFGIFVAIAMSSPGKSAVAFPQDLGQLLEHYKTELSLLKARANAPPSLHRRRRSANRDLSGDTVRDLVSRTEMRLGQLYRRAGNAAAHLAEIANRNGDEKAAWAWYNDWEWPWQWKQCYPGECPGKPHPYRND